MKCEYWKTCKGYRKESQTCNDGLEDKNYCGIYRKKNDLIWQKKMLKKNLKM